MKTEKHHLFYPKESETLSGAVKAVKSGKGIMVVKNPLIVGKSGHAIIFYKRFTKRRKRR